jgi:hypothetical protein
MTLNCNNDVNVARQIGHLLAWEHITNVSGETKTQPAKNDLTW